jgi:hypothetical protein
MVQGKVRPPKVRLDERCNEADIDKQANYFLENGQFDNHFFEFEATGKKPLPMK